MNDYTRRILGLVGNRPAMPLLETAPARARLLLARLEGRFDESLAPEKWTARHIFCHLADVEIVYGFRIRQMLAQDDYTPELMDQDRWADRYPALDPSPAVTSYESLRGWNLDLLRSLSPGQLERTALHPERGPESISHLLNMLAGHDLNHLAQIEQIESRRHAS